MSDVLLSFGAQNITGDASKMLNDLQAAFSKADAVKVNVGLKVDDKALNVFKGQLTKILNGLTLSNGAPVKLRIEGVGELESGVASVKKNLDTTTASAERFKKSLGKMSDADIKSSVKKLSSEYIKMQENLGKFSDVSAKGKKSARRTYDMYLNQADAIKRLSAEVKAGTVAQDEYIDRLARIKKKSATVYNDLMKYESAYKQRQKVTAKPKIGEMSEAEIRSKYKALGDRIAKLQVNSQKHSSANDYTEESKADLKAYNAEIERLKNLQDSLKGKKILSNDFAKEVAEITANLSALDGKLKVFATSADPTKTMVAGTKEYAASLKSVDVEITKTRKNLQEWTAAKNGPASEHYKTLETNLSELEKLYDDVFTGKITKGQFDEAFKRFVSGSDAARKSIKDLGRDTLSAGGKVKEMFGKFSSWFGISQAVMLAVASVKQMVATVIELDSAMTELKKVTDETDATYERFLDKAGTRAKNIGASLTDVVTATADFARLGYDLEEASQLADTAIVYKNVADGIKDIGDASSSIISTVKAFGLEAKDAMSIVDKFNEVDLLAS